MDASNGDWNPSQYLTYADHRLRAAQDLLARIDLDAPQVIYDLGCGPGNTTHLLAQRWPGARVTGVDHAAQMIGAAEAAFPAIAWQRADIAEWKPERRPDLIFSNAALHWLASHETLFPRLLAALRPGGYLAVQMPLSWSQPSHRLMRETLQDAGPNGSALGNAALHQRLARRWVERATFYFDLLAPAAAEVDIWQTEYLQVLSGDDPVFEWAKGTALRPILGALADDQQALFSATYRRRLHIAYPKRADGRTLFPFRRLFVVARARSDPA